MEIQLEGGKSKGYKSHEGRTHLCFFCCCSQSMIALNHCGLRGQSLEYK